MLTELEEAFQMAIEKQAKARNHELTPFDWEVAKSIYLAGLLALEDSKSDMSRYRVVSAPTGSGKSSYAQAFIRAYLDASHHASVLFLVETIDQADDTYQAMRDLLGRSSVAVWTSAHDKHTPRATIEQKHGFIPKTLFSVDDLSKYPVVIATHNFYRGSRAKKAIVYKGANRKLTIVDEKPSDVSVYDVDTGLIKTVRDRLAQKHTTALDHVDHLTMLHDQLEQLWRSADSKQAYDTIPIEADLGWFVSEQANDYISSSDEQVKTVFGFGRALANGFAFLSRYDDAGNGARFVGYELTMPLRPGTILLDATADIDGVSLIVSNREHVRVPRVDFANLTITHIKPDIPKGAKVTEIIKKARLAKPYAQMITRTVKEHSTQGEKVLVVVHKAMLEHEYLPNGHRDFEAPYDLEGRQVCFINWGYGIGSNRWKDASAVFLFGEFHIPKRATIGSLLGLKQQPANVEVLSAFQRPNSASNEFINLKEGHLCRWEKQLAMRGNARNIDDSGVCGVQRLYVTGEFDRFIRRKDQLFPGAKFVIKEQKERLSGGGVEALVSLLYQHDGKQITTVDVMNGTGISFQKNKKRYLAMPVVQKAMEDNRWTFVSGNGRGNPSRFVRKMSIAA